MAEGNEASQGRGDDENREQGERVGHSRDGGESAGSNVGGGAGDGACGGNSAEEGRCDIGEALGDELDIGVVAIAAHAIGNDGGEQAFNGRKQRHGKSGREQGKDVLGVKSGECEMRKTLRNAAEPAADGFDRQMEKSRSSGCEHKRNDGAGTRRVMRGQKRMMARDATATATVCQRRVPA